MSTFRPQEEELKEIIAVNTSGKPCLNYISILSIIMIATNVLYSVKRCDVYIKPLPILHFISQLGENKGGQGH